MCHEGCQPGHYGAYCILRCHEHCNGTACEQDTGHCDEPECDDGFFGEHCLDTCPKGCLQGCHKTTGVCDACKPGYYGKTCNDTCPEECPKKCRSWYIGLNGSTESVIDEFFQPFSQGSEQVLLGSIVVVIAILVVLLSLLYWYRSKGMVTPVPHDDSLESKDSKDDSDHSTDIEEIVQTISLQHGSSPDTDGPQSQPRIEQDTFQEILIRSVHNTAGSQNKSTDSSQ